MRGKRLRVVYGNGKSEPQNRVRRLVQDLMVHVLCVPRSLLSCVWREAPSYRIFGSGLLSFQATETAALPEIGQTPFMV